MTASFLCHFLHYFFTALLIKLFFLASKFATLAESTNPNIKTTARTSSFSVKINETKKILGEVDDLNGDIVRASFLGEIVNGKFKKSKPEDVDRFMNILNSSGVVATVRRELGSDIDAACGQLRKKEVKKC